MNALAAGDTTNEGGSLAQESASMGKRCPREGAGPLSQDWERVRVEG